MITGSIIYNVAIMKTKEMLNRHTNVAPSLDEGIVIAIIFLVLLHDNEKSFRIIMQVNLPRTCSSTK